MNDIKYIKNKINNVIKYSEQLIYIENPIEDFTIKGEGIGELIVSVLNEFDEAKNSDDVASSYINEYSLATIKQLIDLLINKRLIIPVDSDLLNQGYSKEFINRNTYNIELAERNKLTLGKLKDGKVCLTGNNELITSIVKRFQDYDFTEEFIIISNLTKKNIAEIEKDLKAKNIRFNYHNLDVLMEQKEFSTIINDIDFTIVAVTKRENHYLQKLNKIFYDNNKLWVRYYIDDHKIEIGPLVMPQVTSCYNCYLTAISNNTTPENFVYFNRVLPEIENEEIYLRQSFVDLGSSIMFMMLNKYLLTGYSELLNSVFALNGITNGNTFYEVIKNTYCGVCKVQGV